MKTIIDETNIGNKIYFKKFLDFLYKKFNISRKKEINVLFCSIDKIKELNYKYRKQNKATDVLSFYGYDDTILGDIAICPEFAKEYKQLSSLKEREYLLFLLTHGFLHLLGYSHSTKKDYDNMIILQKQILEEWSFK